MHLGDLFRNNAQVPRCLRAFSAIVAFAVALISYSGDAFAYPEFQFSTGAVRCSLCHVSPSGGGLLNGYGRSQAEDISTFGGNPEFLYGIWEEPDWVKFGVDLRVAGLSRKNGTGRDFIVFPMQGDTYVDFFFKDFTAAVIIGPRAQARTPRESALARMNSREHWVMWRPKTQGPYARAGRFYAPFGLRQQDHTTFNRRYLGFHSFEESYNLSGGYVKNAWEAHATLFAPAPGPLQNVLGGGPAAYGVTGYYEKRLGKRVGAAAAQARIAKSASDLRSTVGGVVKYYLEPAKLLLMGELDLTLQTFDDGDSPARAQFTSYLSASYTPIKGVSVTAALQRHDTDLSVKKTAYDAAQLSFQWFARSHLELHTLYRLEFSGDFEKPRLLAFWMLHYFL